VGLRRRRFLSTGLIGLGIDGIDGAMLSHDQIMVAAHLEPCICERADKNRSGRGRPIEPRSQETGQEQGSPRSPLSGSVARTVDRAAPSARVRIAQGGAGRRRGSTAMAEEVYVGIDVSKTELVVAIRPSAECMV
jgi:hypothetical protein